MRELTYDYRLGESRYSLNLLDVTVDESIEVERLTGRGWTWLCAAHDRGEALAVKTFFWLARRHAGEAVEFAGPAMNFRWREFRAEIRRDQSTQDSEGEASPDPTEETDQPKPPARTSRSQTS
ncbi:hypothetical protein [Goodfellowiella coeruleoviolacea]|uniref:Uncharacterized protein n=1 Tax=Goodfellowiella coeruleoviolacea TaxID=334858 RepID=A0AAE3GIK2_9PSEU|nr:hypothetical protein [Goodfellowiella coeruleoviolacea]MCP2168135.1 hypothetical protein [Goodfellowiella coeruleoviolacea]